VTEQKKPSPLSQILKVVYAPHKAFKEIAQNPKYIGPLLIMVIFIVISVGSGYARDTKIYLQRTSPSSLNFNNPDPWTESPTLWASNANANISINTRDYTLHQSIQFGLANETHVWMTLNNIGSIDCVSGDAYRNITYSIKWNNTASQKPENLSIYLFSAGSTEYFYHDLSATINQTGSNEWANVTLPVGPNAQEWINSSTLPTWSNITGLKLEISWAESARSDLTVLVDRLYFQSEKFDQLAALTQDGLTLAAVNALSSFVLNWIILSLTLTIATKLFKVHGTYKISFMIMGYSMITFIFMQIIFGVFYLTLSPMQIYIDRVVPESAFLAIVALTFYVPLLLPVWSIILVAIGLKETFNLGIATSAMMAVIGFIPYYALYLFA
jgi:hypothetical protein